MLITAVRLLLACPSSSPRPLPSPFADMVIRTGFMFLFDCNIALGEVVIERLHERGNKGRGIRSTVPYRFSSGQAARNLEVPKIRKLKLEEGLPSHLRFDLIYGFGNVLREKSSLYHREIDTEDEASETSALRHKTVHMGVRGSSSEYRCLQPSYVSCRIAWKH
ncbi:hypothetical protein BDV96DRAFT_293729 [Lophiotrema nucula]|uniref:Uncharacterized protein n=1 Tax=Lophiotrema nucula TaxID=690887 RepID=A0A6A5YL74_9PLEO|nr:hypothetical protein BDV96DRAFT_293729 [Lophiotrema nucula]